MRQWSLGYATSQWKPLTANRGTNDGLGRNQFIRLYDNYRRLEGELARTDLSPSQRTAKEAKREKAKANLMALADLAGSYYVID